MSDNECVFCDMNEREIERLKADLKEALHMNKVHIVHCQALEETNKRLQGKLDSINALPITNDNGRFGDIMQAADVFRILSAK